MPREEAARVGIDRLLTAAGWVLQDYKHFNPGAALGIALREVPLKSSRCDYLLLVNRAAVSVIEAKREGTRRSGVADQSAQYADTPPPFLQAKANMGFLYESTGAETYFRDTSDPEPRCVVRSLFALWWR
jgi:type I restriction enzyme, R subunit